MKIAAIIPARYKSARLPKKMLCEIEGISIIQWVYNKAKIAAVFDEIIIATDHERIMKHCAELNMNCTYTSVSHQSGTDRIAEVASQIDADIIINIQGDEPLIEPETIQALVTLMKTDGVNIGTLMKKINTSEVLFDFNAVKVVTDNKDNSLYFSRNAIPALRDVPYREWIDKGLYYQHVGMYGFRRDTLLEISKLEMSSLEKIEKLEQLRWLSNGYQIKIKEVESNSFGIDTEEDLIKAREIIKKI
ncbi:MAG: 3-deoxy-manno-octulosonate cytidylyltransferase [Saprospiraceae bacterium]